MKRFLTPLRSVSTTVRIALALAMWSATVLLTLRLFGVIDDGQATALKHRIQLAESMAVACSQAISRNQPEDAAVLMRTLRSRNPEIISLALSDRQGNPIVVAGAPRPKQSTKQASQALNRIEVPIYNRSRPAGQLQLVFTPLVPGGWSGWVALPSVQITLAAFALNFIGYMFLISRSFRRFDPSQVVPERVRSALDTLDLNQACLD